MKRDIKVKKDQLERVRAAFFHPDNRHFDTENFYNALVGLAEGTPSGNSFVSDVSVSILKEMRHIFDLIKNTRKYDETYIGHMLSESPIPAFIGYMTALRIGSNTVGRESSVYETPLEAHVIDWFCDVIGYDKEKASGTVTSGGTTANTTALWAARELFLKKNPEFKGRMLVLGNPFAHYSIKKSLWILGGREGIAFEAIPTKSMKVDPEALKKRLKELKAHNESAAPADQIGVMAVVAIPGETETGLVDPVEEIGEIASEYGHYYHLDGAYGLPYALSSESSLFRGMQMADSVTVDGHKALYIPYSAGFIIFKDVATHALINLTSKDAPYVFKSGGTSLGRKRLEGSMGAGPIIATLSVVRAFGNKGLKTLFDYTLNSIDCLYERVCKSPILYPIHKPELNVLCFSIEPKFLHEKGIHTNDQLRELIETSRKSLEDNPDGKSYFFSSTALPVDGSIKTFESGSSMQPAYRAVLMHPYTSSHEIDESLKKLEKILFWSGRENILPEDFKKKSI